MEKYYTKKSFSSLFVNHFVKYFSNKDIFLSQEKTMKYIENYNVDYKKTINKLKLTPEEGFNIPVYSYNGTLTNPKKRILLYLHGGSFLEEAISFQYKFAMKIAKMTDSTLIVPIYTLAPKGNYKKALQDLNEIWKKIQKLNLETNFLGDSAGGGLALSFSMYLKDNNIKRGKNILLLSPWLDVTLSNPEIVEIEKKDEMTGIAGNKYAGQLWATNQDLKNYLISPLYGNYEDLGLITIVTGEYDSLKPDCVLLKEKLKKSNLKYNYIEYKGQYHDFGAFPTKEGNMVIDDMVKIIKEEFYGE